MQATAGVEGDDGDRRQQQNEQRGARAAVYRRDFATGNPPGISEPTT